ncbi:hypothetical protein [Roseateles sp. LYH14W]|uniref:Tyr recombinase domain-containing protein n=1 Tax=Pelomonas parva TaxID=3299032 RepID=A0ABW7F3H2_9BURK
MRVIADGLEWSYGWDKATAIRLRFLLDFSYSTGLRNSEFVSATLRQISDGDDGRRWLQVVGKGSKRGRVALPPLATGALDRYLVARGLPTTPSHWRPDTPIVGRVAVDEHGAISTARLWAICRRFFRLARDRAGRDESRRGYKAARGITALDEIHPRIACASPYAVRRRWHGHHSPQV